MNTFNKNTEWAIKSLVSPTQYLRNTWHFLLVFFVLFALSSEAFAGKVLRFHERSNGPSTVHENSNIFLDCEIAINGKPVGRNIGLATDASGKNPGSTHQTFIHHAGKKGRLILTIARVDADGRPLSITRPEDINDSHLAALPGLAKYADDDRYKVMPIITNIDRYTTLLDSNGNSVVSQWKAKGIYRGIRYLEVRCVYVFDTQLNKIVECIGCEFYFYGDDDSDSSDSSDSRS